MLKTYQKQKNKGFTLVEMLVAITLFTVVFMLAAASLINMLHSQAKTNAQRQTIQEARYILEGISRDIKIAQGSETVPINPTPWRIYDSSGNESDKGSLLKIINTTPNPSAGSNNSKETHKTYEVVANGTANSIKVQSNFTDIQKGVRKNLDIVLILDASGSMAGKMPDESVTKMAVAKERAIDFVDLLSNRSTGGFNDRVSVVSYEETATKEVGLTNDFLDAENKINSITTAWGTNVDAGMKIANKEILDNDRPDANKVIILLTDGVANWHKLNPGDNDWCYDDIGRDTTCKTAAISNATDIKGTATYYAIGLGKANYIDEKFMEQIVAQTPPGFYRNAPTTGDLATLYTDIFTAITAPVIATTTGTKQDTVSENLNVESLVFESNTLDAVPFLNITMTLEVADPKKEHRKAKITLRTTISARSNQYYN